MPFLDCPTTVFQIKHAITCNSTRISRPEEHGNWQGQHYTGKLGHPPHAFLACPTTLQQKVAWFLDHYLDLLSLAIYRG